jgi:hypothetical protein
MKPPQKKTGIFIFFAAASFCMAVRSQNLDQIGVTALRAVATNADGSGIRVAQPEADDQNTPPGTNTWEVNPAVVGQPTNLFTYISSGGSSTVYTNLLGLESHHAEGVAGNFYGISGGVATNIAHVDNYEAEYFVNNIVATLSPVNTNDLVVNQSFIFTESDGSQDTVGDQQAVDTVYDNYAAQYKTLFVSGAGNGSPMQVNPPATCYNGIGVGVSDGSSSIGPTIDNGRCKPDIIAPGGATSFSTPYVAGAAAVLMQAGLRGDGGGDTNSAADIRTVKALLLNGAVKPADWTNSNSSPLDARYGAGILNVLNSYEQLAGGKNSYIVSTSVSTNGAHPPTGATATITNLSGWDFNTNSSSTSHDGVNHYYFDATNNLNGASFIATATLVWNRQKNKTNINNLDLFLYNCANSNLVTCSTSLVDNVEHIFLPQLAQGRYDLQVWKAGGIGMVNSTEPYALAWEFLSPTLAVTNDGTNTALTFPIYPAGFVVETTTNLSSPVNWSTNDLPQAIFTNNQNYILLDATNSAQFFHLRRP